jgi:hypothetical protein
MILVLASNARISSIKIVSEYVIIRNVPKFFLRAVTDMSSRNGLTQPQLALYADIPFRGSDDDIYVFDSCNIVYFWYANIRSFCDEHHWT